MFRVIGTNQTKEGIWGRNPTTNELFGRDGARFHVMPGPCACRESSPYIREWVVSHVTHIWVSHELCHTHGSCHTYMKESCVMPHTYEWVMGHVAHMAPCSLRHAIRVTRLITSSYACDMTHDSIICMWHYSWLIHMFVTWPLYGGKVAGLILIRFAAEALRFSFAKSSRPPLEMWKCKVKLTIISRFKLIQVFATQKPGIHGPLWEVVHANRGALTVQNLWMFANWYTELNFFCLATFTPGSDDSWLIHMCAAWLMTHPCVCDMTHDSFI